MKNFHKIKIFLDNWKQYEYKFEKLDFGKWRLSIPALSDGSCPIKNGSIIKVISFKIYFFNK